MSWVRKFFVWVTIFGLFPMLSAQEPSELDSNILKSAIDITNISNETQTTNIILESLASDDFDKVILDEIDSSVSARETEIRGEFDKLETQDLSNISKASLDALQSTWSLNKAETEKNAAYIRELFVQTNSDLENLRDQRGNWKATLAVMSTTESPVEMVNNIEAIIAEIDIAETKLNENLSRLVIFETQINDLTQLTLKVEESIEKALEERSKDVFKQNAPVIWNVFWGTNDSVPTDSSVVNSAKIDSVNQVETKWVHWSGEKIRLSMEFVESNQDTIYLHFFLWIITVMLSLRLGKKDIKIEESDRELSFATKSLVDVKKRLFLSATYISILYATFLYEFLPFLITEIIVILLLIINVAIHGKKKGQGVIKIALLLSVLFLTGQMSTETWFSGIYYRLYLFAKAALIFWTLSLFADYLVSYQNVNSPTIWKKLPKLTVFIKFLLIASLFANVFGFIKLSDMTMLLATQILVVSYIFYGILVTSNGLVSLIFNVSWVPKKESSLQFRNTIESMVLKVVNFFGSLFWVKAILSTVGIYEPIMDSVLGFFNSPAEIGTISISLKDISYGILVFIFTYVVTKFIGILIKEGILDRFELKRGVPSAISLVVRYTLFGFGFLLALSVAGIDLTTFSLMAGALGIGIGFGLQNIISNFVSGLILVFERPLQEGDVVEVNNLLGIVRNIGVRSSNIRTYTGSEVVVPNEALISKEVVNWTLSDPHKRLEINIGVDYGSDPREIIKLLTDAALENSDVKRDPAPIAFFEEFGDSSLNFRLLFWVHHTISLGVRSDVMLRVSDTMRKHDINIPFPIRTLVMDKENKKDLISPELLPDPRKNENFGA